MFENGKLDSRPAKLPESVMMPTVADIVPGSVHWIDKDALWFDASNEVWINQAAPLIYYSDEMFVTQFVRIIAFDEGIVVDWTTANDEDGNLRKVHTDSFEEHIDNENFNIGEYKKTIAFITREDELKQIKDLFKQTYGLKFSGKQVKQKVDPKKSKSKKMKTEKTRYTIE